MFFLTPEILTKVSLKIKGQQAIDISTWLKEICPKYGINTADIFHEFIANVLHESDCFTDLSENLNYSAERLMQVWQKRFPNKNIANKYAHNPRLLANFVYGNRLGNEKPNDGWAFRGSGPIQITGYENVSNFTKYYNNKFGTTYTAYEMADLLRTDIAVGIHSACWIFAIAKKLIDLAISDQMRDIVKRINGGFIGLDKRVEIYERAKLYIPEAA
jgi:putative chitinase